jgi:hypothetical protein
MIDHYVPSLGLLRGLRVRDYESLLELETAGLPEKDVALRFANKYLVEKSALPTGRDTFVEELIKLTGFPMKMEVTYKSKGNGEKTKVETPAWSEVQYMANFRKQILAGTFEHPRFPNDEKLLEEALQVFADSLGPFVCDAKRPERKPGTSKIAGWIKERVKIIFDNSTQARWWGTMIDESIPIEPLSGEREKDEVSLMLAIKEREARKEAKEAVKYA